MENMANTVRTTVNVSTKPNVTMWTVPVIVDQDGQEIYVKNSAPLEHLDKTALIIVHAWMVQSVLILMDLAPAKPDIMERSKFWNLTSNLTLVCPSKQTFGCRKPKSEKS